MLHLHTCNYIHIHCVHNNRPHTRETIICNCPFHEGVVLHQSYMYAVHVVENTHTHEKKYSTTKFGVGVLIIVYFFYAYSKKIVLEKIWKIKMLVTIYTCRCYLMGAFTDILPNVCNVLALTPSLRRPCIHAIFFLTACRTACKHAFRFLRVLPEAVSTHHSWLWQTLDDVYTRRCFAESEGTRFGAPGQKALPSVNEFTLLWIFA